MRLIWLISTPDLGCSQPIPLGMESDRIQNADITYSSLLSSEYDDSRLNTKAGETAWVPRKDDTNAWLMVDFRSETLINGIATQGRHSYLQFVTSYTLSYSQSGATFTPYNSSHV